MQDMDKPVKKLIYHYFAYPSTKNVKCVKFVKF